MTTTRPVGPPITSPPANLPSTKHLPGRTIHLEKLSPNHATDLFPLLGGDSPRSSLWDYMLDGPYPDPDSFAHALAAKSASTDPFFYAVIDQREHEPTFGKALGYLSLMRIAPAHLTVEIGHVMFSAALQRTTGATEAIYLLARHAFEDLGYRRVEWKCDSLNAPSRRAALRLGFVFEGVFRQHMVVKGRSRDTAWFSVVRDEWGVVGGALEGWLGVGNFGVSGGQIRSLQSFRG